MKSLLLSFIGICVLFTSLYANAMGACVYSQEPCDDKGNHYRCFTYGWIGDHEFCSPTDRSRKLEDQTAFLELRARSNDPIAECIADCVSNGGAPSTCHHRCW